MRVMSTVIRGRRLRIYPSEEQKAIIQKFIDLYRYVYNWGIAKQRERYRLYKDGKSEYGFYQFHELVAEYHKFKLSGDNIWLLNLPDSTSNLALQDVCFAYLKYFKAIQRREKVIRPNYKSKKTAPMSFKTRNNRFYIDGDKVRFEGLPRTRWSGKEAGLVDLGFDTGFRKKDKTKFIRPSIVLDKLGRYWVCFAVERSVEEYDRPKTEVLGIDLGVRNTITLSTGETFHRPQDKIDRVQKRLKRAAKHYYRDILRRQAEARRTKTKYEEIPVSKRSQKRLRRVIQLNEKITHIKEAFYHKTIKEIVARNPEAIVLENIKVRKFVKSKALKTADFYKMRMMFQDKCELHNIPVILAPENYQSSQICSNCGSIRKPSNATYICHECGLRIDRDVNAALNLKSLYSVA